MGAVADSGRKRRNPRVSTRFSLGMNNEQVDAGEGFNDWGGRGYDDFVPGEVIEIAPSGGQTS